MKTKRRQKGRKKKGNPKGREKSTVNASMGCYNIPFGVIMKSCNLEKDIGRGERNEEGSAKVQKTRYYRSSMRNYECEGT